MEGYAGMTITLTNTNWQDDKSTKEQRQRIDVVLRRNLRLDYAQLLSICSKEVGRKIIDLTQLTKGEASNIIDLLQNGIHN